MKEVQYIIMNCDISGKWTIHEQFYGHFIRDTKCKVITIGSEVVWLTDGVYILASYTELHLQFIRPPSWTFGLYAPKLWNEL